MYMALVSFRIDKETWAEFKKRAHHYDMSASAVLREFINWYNIAGNHWKDPFK